jgi:hypothetical protein
MAEIDRLGWAAATCFQAYGVRVGVRVNQAEILARLARLFPPGSRPTVSSLVDELYSVWVGERRAPAKGFHVLYAGVARRARTTSLDELLENFEADLRLRVAAAARRHVFVHAGVVGWRGRAIVLPGRSGSGKTTLVAELLRAGGTYYSDEFAVIDQRGWVHPFAKPLSIRDGKEVRKRRAEDMGGAVGTTPLPIGLIAFSTYRAGARRRPVPISPGQGVLALIPHTVPVRRRPEASLAALQRAVQQARLLKTSRGRAEDAAAWLLRHVGETAGGAA